MAYKPLRSIFHQSGTNSLATLNDEYRLRKASPAALQFDYLVGDYPLFVLHTAEVAALIETVWRLQSRIQQLWHALPGAARRHYLIALLVSEIQATNEIENIYSTRKEVVEALDAVSGKVITEKARLREMALMFVGVLGADDSSQTRFPQSVAEVRELYDKLLGSQIAEADQLDGEYFRVGGVEISDGSRTIHSGVAGEQKIIQRIESMLAAQSDASSHQLVSALVGHFMFEHTHPFYDGNGRFGRFLLAIRLKELLGSPVALSLSSEVLRQKNSYYKAFIGVEHELNRAEATHFLETMLKILVDAQESLLDSLEQKKTALAKLQQQLKVLAQTKDEFEDREIQILLLLGQVYLFGPRSGVRLDEVATYLDCAEQTARKALKSLEERDLVDKIQARPLVFQLSGKGHALTGID